MKVGQIHVSEMLALIVESDALCISDAKTCTVQRIPWDKVDDALVLRRAGVSKRTAKRADK